MNAVSDPITLNSLVELAIFIAVFLCWVKGLIMSFRSNSPLLGFVCIFMPLIGVVIGVACAVGGVIASFYVDAPSGATIVLLTLACFLLALPVGALLRRST